MKKKAGELKMIILNSVIYVVLGGLIIATELIAIMRNLPMEQLIFITGIVVVMGYAVVSMGVKENRLLKEEKNGFDNDKYYKKTDEIFTDISNNPTFKAMKHVDYDCWWGSDYKVIGNTYMVYGSIEHCERGFDNKIIGRKISLYFRKRGAVDWLLSGAILHPDDFRDGVYAKLQKYVLELYDKWRGDDKKSMHYGHRWLIRTQL